jgi:hypothetical protein
VDLGAAAVLEVVEAEPGEADRYSMQRREMKNTEVDLAAGGGGAEIAAGMGGKEYH